MKKIAAFLFALLVSVSLLAAADFAAEVVSVSGKAEVLDGASWRALAIGDTLKNGDTIQTGFRSSLVLKLKDSTINVAALTRMTVEQLSENSESDSVRVFVNAGGVTSNANATAGKKLGFTVRTPVATASVRGTEFSVENTFGSTNVQTTQGAVAVWSGSNSVSVAASEEAGGDGESAGAADDAVEASFDTAPRGTVVVTQSQTAQLASTGTVTAPSQVAANAAVNIGGALDTPAGAGSQRNAETGAAVVATTLSISVGVEAAN